MGLAAHSIVVVGTAAAAAAAGEGHAVSYGLWQTLQVPEFDRCMSCPDCRMDIGLWSKFLDWLSESGLLTTKAQSREAADTDSSSFASLDGMRQGDAGEQIPRDSIIADNLATNQYLQSTLLDCP
jgi:hypothetical protein